MIIKSTHKIENKLKVNFINYKILFQNNIKKSNKYNKKQINYKKNQEIKEIT